MAFVNRFFYLGDSSEAAVIDTTQGGWNMLVSN